MSRPPAPRPPGSRGIVTAVAPVRDGVLVFGRDWHISFAVPSPPRPPESRGAR